MAAPSEDLLQLERIQAQLASDNPVLCATSKFTITHLTFNTFLESNWSMASIFPQLQIGVRNGQPVHAFPLKDAFCTVASGRSPNLTSIIKSRETLEDVELVEPFASVDEWKSEMSGSGNLSREFRALMKYLFLLHHAEGGPNRHLGLPVDVEDLKVALMMIHQARQAKVYSPSPGSVKASDAESAPEPTNNEPTIAAHPADQPAPPDVETVASHSMQLDDQDIDQDSFTDASHEKPLSHAPTSASTSVPVFAHDGLNDELEDVDDGPTGLVLEDTSDEATPEGSDQTEVPDGGPAPRGLVKGLFTVNGPNRTLPIRKQVVPVADDTSETDTEHFISSNRKDFRDKSKPPDDRRTEDAAKAVKSAEKQAEPQPDTPARDDGTVGYDDETDIEVVDASEPDENTDQSSPASDDGTISNGEETDIDIVDGSEPDEDTHQSPLPALSESPDAEAETQHDVHMDVVQDPGPARGSTQGPVHDHQGSPIERVAFRAAARIPSQQQKAYNTIRRSAAGKHTTSLSGDFRSMTVGLVARDTEQPAAGIPLKALSTEQLRMIAYGENTAAAFDGRVPLAKRILAQRAVQAGSVILRGRSVREYENDVLERYAAGKGPVDDSWVNDRMFACAELERRAALVVAEYERRWRNTAQKQQVTSRPPPVQPPTQPHTQASRQPPVRNCVQTSVQARMQPQIQAPTQPPARARFQLPVQAPLQLPLRVPLQLSVAPRVESIAALRELLGDEGLRLLLHEDQRFTRMRHDFPPFVVPLGVVVGVLRENVRVAVAFHVMLPQHPAEPVGKAWYAFSAVNGTCMTWNLPDPSHERVVAEIDLYPTFRLEEEEDFLALLCLVVICESERWLGGPYSHHIPIAYYCRGRLIEMCRALTTVRANSRAERELQERCALQGELQEAMPDQTGNIQPHQQAEAAQALLGIPRNTNVPATQHLGSRDTDVGMTQPIQVESFAALEHMIGEDSLKVLREPWDVFLGHQPSDQTFLPVGILIGRLANNRQIAREVFAFLATEFGTLHMAPLLLLTRSETDGSWLELAKSENIEAIMPAIQLHGAFHVVDTVEDLLALVSLGILEIAATGKLDHVDHKIPIVPWCRGHLAVLTKRVDMRKQAAERLRPLKRSQQQVAQEAGADHIDQPQHHAKRTRTEPPHVQSRDEPFTANGAAAAAAAAAGTHTSGPSLDKLISRNCEAAHVNTRYAERIFVWHTQNVAARQIMTVLVRDGKTETQQYRDLEAMTSAREKQMHACLLSGMFTNNEICHQVNICFLTQIARK